MVYFRLSIEQKKNLFKINHLPKEEGMLLIMVYSRSG